MTLIRLLSTRVTGARVRTVIPVILNEVKVS